MKKSLIALAVAGAFAVPAYAATGNIDISGKVAADVTFVSGVGGATPNANTHQVNNNNSIITVSGSEDLGGGMKAFMSLTYGLPLSQNGLILGQNQIAGLEGGFGKVFVGAFDNPLKVMGSSVDLFRDQSTGDSRNMTRQGNVETRANDVVAYLTPVMSGFQGVLAHTNNPLGATAVSGGDNTAMWIGKVAYNNGPLSLAAGYHTIDLPNNETAWRLVGGYTIGDIKLVASYQDVKHPGGAAGDLANVKTWGLGAAYAMGPITLKTQYYKNDVKLANADSSMWALGADYALSKRTTAQFAYSKVTNDTLVNLGGGGVVAGSDVYGVAAGADPSRVSIGMKHSF